MISYFGITW